MNNEILDSVAQGMVASVMVGVIFERKGFNAILSQKTFNDGLKFAVANVAYKMVARPLVANATGINLPKV